MPVAIRCQPVPAAHAHSAAQCQHRGARLDLHWVPRDQNQLADQLTHEDFRGFSMDRRVPVDIEKLPFLVLAPPPSEEGDLCKKARKTGSNQCSVLR